MIKSEDQDSRYQTKEENIPKTSQKSTRKVTQEIRETTKIRDKKKVKAQWENTIQKSIRPVQEIMTHIKETIITNPGMLTVVQKKGREALVLDIGEETPRLCTVIKGEKTTITRDMITERKEMIEKAEVGGGPMAKDMINEGTAQGP